jgi:uncharacterized membrane protein YesL
MLILPFPFVIFGLFGAVCDIGEGRGINLGTLFSHAGRMWKQAYIWGGINLGVFIILFINIAFYSNVKTQWAAFAQILVIGFTLFWTVLQLVALPIYPRLREPGFRLAARNATVMIGRYPLPILILVAIIGVILLIWVIFRSLIVIILMGGFSITAVVTNRMVEALLEKELKREPEA